MDKKIIKVGVVGASGYSGLETLKLLLKHDNVRIGYVSANNTEGKLTDIWPQLAEKTNLVCKKYDFTKAKSSCELIFLAVPHTVAMAIAPQLLKSGIKVIDLSGDYRLDSAAEYKKWYGAQHKNTPNLKKAVYGLPEFYREDIKKASLVANPGCYPTAALLGLAPAASTMSKNIESIIIDAKSGVSGAGRKANVQFSFSELSDNFKAYKVLNHQHAPEIELYLSKIGAKDTNLNFVPHLLPVDRGILETIYVRLKKKVNLSEVHKIYKRFYKTEKFVRVLPKGIQPELKNVTHTNYCDIGLALNQEKNLLVITSTIDNLMKGAASQAVQNMNIMFGFKEDEGIK